MEPTTKGIRKPNNISLRSAIFDIETCDFSTGGIRNHLICVSIFPLDLEKPFTLKLKFEDEGDDKNLLSDCVATLEEYDILIGHNIAAFDFNWLFSRLAYHNLPMPSKRWLYYDTYQAAKRMAIKADRKSLAFLCDFFQVEYEKTSILPVAWSKVDSRDRVEFEAAIDQIVYHCETDVASNRQLFNCLFPLDRSMTSLPVFKK